MESLVMQLMSMPQVQTMVLAFLVKLVTDQVKPLLQKMDSDGTEDKYKAPIGMVVLVCSVIATIGNLALDHKLASLDVSTYVSNLLTMIVSAMGLHAGSKSLLKTTLGRETLTKDDSK